MNVLVRTIRRPLVAALAVGTLATAGCTISRQQEIALGRQYAAQVDQELPIVHDATVNRYLSALGAEIAAQAGRRDVTYRFHLVNSNVANAFAVPGGWIYINRGIVSRAGSMSELAGVLAHEIAHVERRHSAEQLGRAQTANTGLALAYALLGRTPSDVERAAVGVGGSLYFAGHSREDESEADAAAVDMLVRAGIDPRGLPRFFERLRSEQSRSSGGVGQWFATHPTTAGRIDHVNGRIARYPASRLRGLQQNSNAFRNFKAAVARLPAARE